MKIIISPAKKMRADTDTLQAQHLPVFLSQAEYLLKYLKSLPYGKAKELWNCNDKIAAFHYEKLQTMDLKKSLTPALLAYQGLQYQYMAPAVLEDNEWEYIQRHVRILSGFYGIVKPLDGVVPYRLEMQAKVQLPLAGNLYEYWGDMLYREIAGNTKVILNLASKEYSRCIEKYVTNNVKFVTCVFGEYGKNGKIVTKGTYAKMARGEMVRYLAKHRVQRLSGVRKFDRLGYRYLKEASNDSVITFIRYASEDKGGDLS